MSRLILVAVIMTAAVVTVSSQSSSDDKQSPPVAVSGDAKEALLEKAFFGSYRTVTRTGVSLATSTVYATCISGTDTTKLCGGRKKRTVSKADLFAPEAGSTSLDSSQDELDGDDEVKGKDVNEKLLGGIYTIWTTGTTSTTVTTRYTNTATTISLSYYCTAGGQDYPGIFCG